MLRSWKESDRQQLAALNSDPAVMRYFPRAFTLEESNVFVNVNARRLEREGWGCWAVETIGSGEFIGFVGFSQPADWHPCAGEIDIGWRLVQEHWGRGYATEAALGAIEVGFDSIGFDKIVSFTSACNLPSINVMKKIGMYKDGPTFEHPRIEANSHLRTHVVFRLTRKQWIRVSTA